MDQPRWVLAPNPGPMTLDGTRAYIVGVRQPVVIDPGPKSEAHLTALLDLLDGVTPLAILLTHAHRDHSGCAIELAARTGAPLKMSAGAIDAEWLTPHTESLLDGEAFSTDEGELRALGTPGHAPEHSAFVWTDGAGEPRGVFVGDLLLGEGDTTLVAHPEGHVGDYLRSLDLVRTLDAPILYPTHGPPIVDPRQALRRFREHRLERIRKVEEVLGADPWADSAGVVDAVYGDKLPAELRELAVASVEAILRYRG